jgi:spore coat polysaccharide biosynthesis protein SpsF
MEGTAVVLQARMGSTRLPGKVLARIGSRSILAHCIQRLGASGLRVIVATTTRPEDDAIEREAERHGVPAFRGDADNVLARYIGAARAHGLRELVRATADNPLVDGGGARRSLDLLQRVQADHVVESGLPIGTAVEAVTVAALEQSSALIEDPYDREHVTSFIRRDNRFRALRAVAPGDLRRPGLRLTVDTQEDLDFLRTIAISLRATEELPPLSAVIRAAEHLLVSAVATKRTQQKGA